MKGNNRIKLGVPNNEGQLSLMFTRGGSREGAGRKGIGQTKKISLTLTEEAWQQIEELCEKSDSSRSEVIRTIIDTYLSEQNEPIGGD
jgi:Spy/CpxP family protein refolding chaperone